MSNFDIGTLLNFKPPKYLCEKCKGLLFGLESDWKSKTVVCPICKVTYKGTEHYPWNKASAYLEHQDFGISFADPVEHGRKLAAIAYSFNMNKGHYPPMRALLEALHTANKFVHFTTYGLSRTLYGALKIKAQAIPIRGIASNIQPDFAKEIREHALEAPRLELVIFEQAQSGDNWDRIPHQKLLVIDGLMAFKGAANLTDSGWRKAASGLDHIEVMTNVQEIAELHNKLFSPIWAEHSSLGSEVDMTDLPF